MKRGQVVLVIALLLGAGMFLCARLMLRQAPPHRDHGPEPFVGEEGNFLPELKWLRQTLHLNEAQFEKVKALHLAYRPLCENLCKRMLASDESLLATAKRKDAAEADVAAALRERADLRLECQRSMVAHVRETAACMDSKQAATYLEIVLPYALGMKSTCCGDRSE